MFLLQETDLQAWVPDEFERSEAEASEPPERRQSFTSLDSEKEKSFKEKLAPLFEELRATS